MTCELFYMIALPFIVLASIAGIISAYSSYRNYRIQSKWAEHYYKHHKES